MSVNTPLAIFAGTAAPRIGLVLSALHVAAAQTAPQTSSRPGGTGHFGHLSRRRRLPEFPLSRPEDGRRECGGAGGFAGGFACQPALENGQSSIEPTSPAAQGMAIGIAGAAGFNLVREFLPDIAHRPHK